MGEEPLVPTKHGTKLLVIISASKGLSPGPGSPATLHRSAHAADVKAVNTLEHPVSSVFSVPPTHTRDECRDSQ